MTRTFLLRLVCDFIAIGLLVVGLAYYWLGNLAHEVAGTGMFLLILVHNLFNRRWYKTLAPGRPRAGGLINRATIVLLAAAMLVLLLTSLMISRSMFTFLPFSGGFSTRQIHILVAWWALIIVSLHLGMRWAMLMNLAQHLCQIHRASALRTALLRGITAVIAIQGIRSSFDLGLGTKLTAQLSIDFWDFNQSTIGFFAHLLAIIGLYMALGHYVTRWSHSRNRPSASRWGAAIRDVP